WVVEYPRGRRGRGICRIETQQMAENLAGMLNHAFSLGAGTNQARWDELRGRVMEENEGADPISGDLGWVLRAMDEIEGAPPGGPRDAMRARWAAENAPDPGPTDRQLTDWAEHDAHADGVEPEAEC